MVRQFVTVVFCVDDVGAFEPMIEQLRGKMMVDSGRWSVSAMSLGDEMTRSELIETAVRELDDKYEIKAVVEKISSTPLSSLEGKVVADFY